MKYTQGEWIIEKAGINFYIDSENRNICELRGEDNETEANAKLIAASPELLEALTDFLNMYEKLTETMVSRIGWDVAAKAKRAINKATL